MSVPTFSSAATSLFSKCTATDKQMVYDLSGIHFTLD